MQRLLTRKGQQPLGQKRPAFRRLQRPGEAWRILRIRLHQLKAADDHRQQVVKIMRQASGQLADGLHLLAVQQRLLQLLTLNPIDLHLGGLLFQQPGGVLQRRRIARENVKGARQFAQLVAPLQGRHRDVRLSLSQPRHRPRDSGQVRAQVTVDVPPGAAGDRQRQQRGKQNKHADGAQLPMALRRPLFGGFRHPGHVLIDVVVKQRDQRFDVVHVPADRQVALLQLGRQRGQLRQLPGDVGENKRQRGIGALSRQVAAQLVELQNDRPRRDGMDRGGDQPVHLG